MFQDLLYIAEIVETNLVPILIFGSITVITVGVISFYFYSITETSQAIRVLKKYQDTEYQELEVLDDKAAGSRVFILIGTEDKKRVIINRFGKISEINE